MLQKLVGVGLDQRALQKTVTPRGRNRRRAVVGAGKLAACRGRNVRIAALIRRVEHGVAEVAGRGERLERDAERIRRGVVRAYLLPLAGTGRAAPGCLGRGCGGSHGEDLRLRLAGQRQEESPREIAAGAEDGRRLARRPGGVAGELHGLLFRGEEEHHHRRDPRQRLGIELIGSMRPGEGLASPSATASARAVLAVMPRH